jgi:hypothetical protein
MLGECFVFVVVVSIIAKSWTGVGLSSIERNVGANESARSMLRFIQ